MKKQFRDTGIALVVLSLILLCQIFANAQEGAVIIFDKAYDQQMKRWAADTRMRVEFELKAMNPRVDPAKVQMAYREDIEIKRVKNGKVKIIAYQYSSIVYDNQGQRITVVRARKGKLKHAWELKDGEYWGMHQYDFKEHRATVEVKEVEGP